MEVEKTYRITETHEEGGHPTEDVYDKTKG